MALTYSYSPQADVGFGVTQTALAKWLDRQKRSREQFSAAEQPLQQSVQMFQPGGGYGRGQATLFRDEARRAGAEATSQQVASGMSSGSLSTGTGLRIKRDLATSLSGVEDTRTEFLNRALSNLSGLRGQQAGLTAQVNDPTFAPTMGYLGQRFGQVANLNMSAVANQGNASWTTPSTVGPWGQTRVTATPVGFKR